jgi:hypothetical protein
LQQPPEQVEHALWIGGPPRCAKTTIARLLARRHGLRLYSADTRTWAHRDRALAAGVAAAQRWESLRPAERWIGATDDLLEMSLHAERGPMVLADVGGLPDSPLVVAEGSTIPIEAISSAGAPGATAVWLLPTAEFQDAQMARQGAADGVARLYRLLRSTAEQDLRDKRLPVLVVDGSRSVSEMVRAVE